MAKTVKNYDLIMLGAGGAGLFCTGDASGGWTIDKPMPAISAGNWMVSSGYMAGIAAAKYLGKA
jgi:succinate dehydrogenase/fumarate reductase flavoprotein subunit